MPARNGFLNTRIFPHVPHSVMDFHVRESLIGRYIRFRVIDEFSQSLEREREREIKSARVRAKWYAVKGAYPCSLVFIIDLLGLHDIQQHFECNDNIGVNDCASLATLIFRETLRVNNSHLFYDC